ncbi:MAG: hypothetical protein ABJS57_16360 [Algibacter sp.]
MKKEFQFSIITILLFTSIIYAQDYTDYLVDENNNKIFCKITQIKNGKVKYRLQGKSYSTIKTITKFSDVKFNNPDVIKNPLGLKIEKPESGYSHVYFYFSEIIYKVRYNGKKLTSIGVGNYYLHKIKAGETHIYSSYGNNLEIVAENQKTYLIRGSETGKIDEQIFSIDSKGETKFERGLRISPKLVLDNRKISEYALLSMKKKAE